MSGGEKPITPTTQEQPTRTATFTYTAVYWGASTGGPSDWGVEVTYSGDPTFDLRPYKKLLLLVRTEAEATEIAALLTRTRSIVAPDMDPVNRTYDNAQSD